MSKVLRSRKGTGKLTYVMLATLVVCITASAFAYVMFNYIWTPQITLLDVAKTPEGETIPVTSAMRYFYESGGQLTINLYSYDSYDDSSVTSDRPKMYVYHSSGIDFNAPSGKLFGSMAATTNTTTGDLWVSDNGILYLVADHDTGTAYYLDDNDDLEYAVSGPDRWDYDDDGIDEYRWKLDFKNLAKLTAGESSKSVTMNAYLLDVDATPTLTADYSSTDLTATAYVETDIAEYIEIDAGDAIKITRIYLTLPNDGNNSYVDNGTIQIKYLKLTDGSKSWRFSDFTYDYGAKRVEFDIGVAHTTQEFDGIPILREVGEGARFATIYLDVSGKLPEAGGHNTWDPTIYVVYINPAGTIASTSLAVSFG